MLRRRLQIKRTSKRTLFFCALMLMTASTSRRATAQPVLAIEPEGAIAWLHHESTEGASIYELRFSPDGSKLAARNSTHDVVIWNWREKAVESVLPSPWNQVSDFCFTQDGNQLVTVDAKERSLVWNIATGKTQYQLPLPGTMVRAYPDQTIGIFHEQNIHFAHVPPDDKQETKLMSRSPNFSPCASSQDGRRIVYESNAPTVFPNGIRNNFSRKSPLQLMVVPVGRPNNAQRLPPAEGLTQAVELVASPMGEQVIVAFRRESRLAWMPSNGSQGRELNRAHSEAISDLAVSPDGRFLASSSWDGTVGVWETSTTEKIFELKGHNDKVLCVEFSPDGRYIASASAALDSSVIVWDFAELLMGSRQEKATGSLEAHWNAIRDKSALEAYRSVAWLAQHPDQALDFIVRKFVDDQTVVTATQLTQWIELLDNDSYEQREAAFRKLYSHRESLTEHLLRACEQTTSLEIELQLRRILSADDQESTIAYSERKQLIRAFFLLEQFDDPRALRILKYFANQKGEDVIYAHAAEVWARKAKIEN